MAKKHNVRKERSPSNYKFRLADRGLGKAPTMPSVEVLRKRQETLTENLLAERKARKRGQD